MDIYDKINDLYDRKREIELGGGDERIEKQHAKGKLIKAESGLDGIGIPVHPGAQKYFDEVNKK